MKINRGVGAATEITCLPRWLNQEDIDGLLRKAHAAEIMRRREQGYKSAAQWGDEWHVTSGQARRRLRVMFLAGNLEASQLPVEGMDGITRWVPVYRTVLRD